MAVISPDIPIDEFMTGEKFEVFCDVDTEKNKDYLTSIKNMSRGVVTVFVQTHDLKTIIPEITRLKKKLIIVSHNSDGAVIRGRPSRDIYYEWKDHPRIVHWFCQNCEVEAPNVTPIPIALENTYVFKPEVKQQYMIDVRGAKKELKIFVCHNVGTNPEERMPPIKQLTGQPWATIVDGHNNINLYKQYFDQMAKHWFMLCPDGNGFDTVRLWEALYLGCIPIVKNHVFTEYFAKHLPIVIVKSWKEITQRFLMNKLIEMDAKEYNYDMLRMSYWMNVIGKKQEEVERGLRT